MAKLLKLRRGTTSQHGSFTGAEGEVTVDTDKETVVIHDGSTAGGHPVAAEDMANVSSSAIAGRLSNDSIATSKLAAGALPSDVTVASANIVDGSIVNADVNASAAIAGTKISPDFGSQNIATTGTLGSSDFTITSSDPTINLVDSGNNPDYMIQNNSGQLRFRDTTSNSNRLVIESDGHVDVIGNLDVGAGIDVTGNITTTGDIRVPDDKSLFVGGSDDFQLTHRSSDNVSILSETGGGNLSIETNGAQAHFYDKTNGRIMAHFVTGGECSFKHGATTRLSTTSSGATVTGNLAVTGTVDGRDVATDGTKLDGIEASATADQTAAEIRTLVESASDSNVFTDADHSKLNGIEASATADQSNAEIRAAVEAASDSNVFTDADHTKLNGIEASATADQTGAEIASALNGQDVLTTGIIGRDSNDHINFTDNTRMDITINNSNEFRFESDGDFHADGDVYAFSTTVASDENLKKDIVTVTDAVTKVEALKGVTFKWNKNDADSAGVIAQDVEKVLPQVVKTVADIDGNNYKAVNYSGLTSILIEAIKDLSARVKVLEAK